MGEKQNLIKKRKKFQWTKEMVEYLLDSLKSYKVMFDFSVKDFSAEKTVQYSTLRKEMAKNYDGCAPGETSANPKADLSIQEKKEFEEKIKLENKCIDTGYNRVFQNVKILRQGFSKVVYQHFEVMISISGGNPNVEPVPFGIDSVLENNNNNAEDSSHNDDGESGDNGNASISPFPQTTTNDSDSNYNNNEMENLDAAKSSGKSSWMISKYNTACIW